MDTTKIIETDVWERDPDNPGMMRHVRQRTVREVLDDLREVLGEYPRGGEEGLSVTCWRQYDAWKREHIRTPDHTAPVGRCCDVCSDRYIHRDRQPWPHGRVIVYVVTGGSEGHYTHVDVIDTQDGERYDILLAKTFQGLDAAWGFARRIVDLLDV